MLFCIQPPPRNIYRTPAMIPYAIYMNTGYFTVQLEMTHGLDFKTPKFPHHVIYSRYCLDEENP